VLLAPAAPQSPFTAALIRVNLLGNDLVAARDRLGMTAATQAAEIGIGLATLTGLTAGTTNPTRTTIAAALQWLSSHR
jgi:predicted transcriptional regulator